MSSIIELNNVSFNILNKLSLSIAEGTITTIIGSSSSGKTTLANILHGNTIVTGVKVNNIVLASYNSIEFKKITGFMAEDLNDNFLNESLYTELSFILENLRYKEDAIERKILELCTNLKIVDLLSKYPSKMSHTEKTMASLAIALIHDPKILIIDNSLSSLNDDKKNFVFKYLKKLQKTRGITIVYFTKELDFFEEFDRLTVLHKGEIILDGKPFDVVKQEKTLIRLGFYLPFMYDLSSKLCFYDILKKPELNRKDLVDILWK